jgi:hypothetical protein
MKVIDVVAGALGVALLFSPLWISPEHAPLGVAAGVLLVLRGALQLLLLLTMRGSGAPLRPGADLVGCPRCGRPTDSLKVFRLMDEFLFLVLAIRWRAAGHVGCPPCARKAIAESVESWGLFAGGHVLWPLFVGLPAAVMLIVSYVPGHSRQVRKSLSARRAA